MCFCSARLAREKSHLAAGLGLRLVENGFRVLYHRTASLVQKLQAARRDLALDAAIGKLFKYHLLILDDFSYVTSEGAENQRSLRAHRRALREPLGAWPSPPSTAPATVPTPTPHTTPLPPTQHPTIIPAPQRRDPPYSP